HFDETMTQKIRRAHFGPGIFPQIAIIRLFDLKLNEDIKVAIVGGLRLDGRYLPRLKAHQTHPVSDIEASRVMNKSEVGHFGQEPSATFGKLINVVAQAKEQ